MLHNFAKAFPSWHLGVFPATPLPPLCGLGIATLAKTYGITTILQNAK